MVSRVMIIDPHNVWFLRKGDVLDDGTQWKTIDIGLGDSIHIEAWKVMDADRATGILKEAAQLRFDPIVAAQGRERARQK